MRKFNRRNRIRKKRTIIIITILISIVFLAPVYAYMRKQSVKIYEERYTSAVYARNIENVYETL